MKLLDSNGNIRQAVCVIMQNCFDRILLSRRIGGGSFHGFYQCAGGALEIGEEPVIGALRELREETGLIKTPTDLHFMLSAVGNNRNVHFIQHFYWLDLLPGETAKRTEPEEAEDWLPYDARSLPGPLMPNLEEMIFLLVAR